MITRKTLAKAALCSTLLLSAASLPYSASKAHAQTVTTVTLTQGMSGEQVYALQRNLKTLGFFTYPTITGYYGSITAQAVQNFQRAYSLAVDGIAGPITKSAIARALVKKSIVDDSYNYLRVPYSWGGTSPSTGFDCSGFIYYMFTSHGVSMERTTSSELYAKGTYVSRSRLMPGDLVFFSINARADHVGIYIGDGKFISPLRSAGVYVQNLDNNSYWSPKYLGAKRIY
jgi:peptidoglycan endopeptidase LytF